MGIAGYWRGTPEQRALVKAQAEAKHRAGQKRERKRQRQQLASGNERHSRQELGRTGADLTAQDVAWLAGADRRRP